VKRGGPVDELIAKTPGWRGATLAKLRRIIHDADPEIEEDVKWKRPSNPLGSAVWTHDGVVCFGIILKERVRLSFSAGSRLPDPKKLFNAQLLLRFFGAFKVPQIGDMDPHFTAVQSHQLVHQR
jgi:hypothetical protein